jgi:hypothetical protein
VKFSSIFSSMNDRPEDRSRTLFSIKADAKTFPAELWQRFKQTAERRGDKVIEVLRRLIEQYIREEPKP